MLDKDKIVDFMEEMKECGVLSLSNSFKHVHLWREEDVPKPNEIRKEEIVHIYRGIKFFCYIKDEATKLKLRIAADQKKLAELEGEK